MIDFRLAGLRGGRNIASSDGAVTGLEVFAFVPDQDTVVSVMTGVDVNGNAVDFKTTMGLTGKTLKAGSYYAVEYRSKITAITLTSGQIATYKTVDYQDA